jgi:hypothetical protein
MACNKLIRPLHCHPIHFVQGRASERSEGSVVMGSEMLRCAQHDMALTHTNAWINLLICIISVQLASHEVVQ